GKSALVAMIPILVLGFGMAYAFHAIEGAGFKIGLANAIPLAVISSSIAIPTAQHLSARNREFVTYESSLSDIFGVLIFNFIIINDHVELASVGIFFVDLLFILAI